MGKRNHAEWEPAFAFGPPEKLAEEAKRGERERARLEALRNADPKTRMKILMSEVPSISGKYVTKYKVAYDRPKGQWWDAMTEEAQKGSWSRAETERLIEVTLEYLQEKNVTVEEYRQLLIRANRSQRKHEHNLKGMWMKIAAYFPHRRVINVKEKGEQVFHPFRHYTPWSKEEIAELYKLVRLHGPRWQLISSKIGRHTSETRRKYENLQGRNKTSDFAEGTWTVDDEDKLIELVKAEYPTGIPRYITWDKIASKMGRGKMACQLQWYRSAQLRAFNLPRKWSKFHYAEFVVRIKKSLAREYDQIPWESFPVMYGSRHAKKQFNKALEKHNLAHLPFREQIKRLEALFCRDEGGESDADSEVEPELYMVTTKKKAKKLAVSDVDSNDEENDADQNTSSEFTSTPVGEDQNKYNFLDDSSDSDLESLNWYRPEPPQVAIEKRSSTRPASKRTGKKGKETAVVDDSTLPNVSHKEKKKRKDQQVPSKRTKKTAVAPSVPTIEVVPPSGQIASAQTTNLLSEPSDSKEKVAQQKSPSSSKRKKDNVSSSEKRKRESKEKKSSEKSKGDENILNATENPEENIKSKKQLGLDEKKKKKKKKKKTEKEEESNDKSQKPKKKRKHHKRDLVSEAKDDKESGGDVEKKERKKEKKKERKEIITVATKTEEPSDKNEAAQKVTKKRKSKDNEGDSSTRKKSKK